jgi:hypothetical protein
VLVGVCYLAAAHYDYGCQGDIHEIFQSNMRVEKLLYCAVAIWTPAGNIAHGAGEIPKIYGESYVYATFI